MADESVAHFLGRREQELIAQIKALKGQLAPLEAELAQVQTMRSFLPGGANSLEPSDNVATEAAKFLRQFAHDEAKGAFSLTGKYVQMTIKELVVQALLDGFPDGTTAAKIRDFIRDAYRRPIEPSSLRPQMHRLKEDGRLVYDQATEKWRLPPAARRQYALYDHPTSRQAMRELKDDVE